MSSTIAPLEVPDWSRGRRRQEPPDRRPAVEVVPTRAQRRARPRTVYAAMCIGAILAIIVAQLLLSIAMSQGAYQINSLQNTTKQLQRSQQVASEDLDRLSSPQNLASNASALGMVINSNPVYLRLSDGAVLGTPIAADSGPGSVTGTARNLVPDSLLKGIPLVNGAPAASAPSSPSATAPAKSGSPSAPEAAAAAAPLPLDGALPSPTTH